MQNYSGEEELCCVYVPTNHLYIGDVFLVNSQDVIRPNLSVREGIGEFFFLSLCPELLCPSEKAVSPEINEIPVYCFQSPGYMDYLVGLSVLWLLGQVF